MALLYAIASTMERARFFLEGHVPYLQLRFKHQPIIPHVPEITEWVQRYPKTRIIINDEPDIVVSTQAWGVHLGQEDLQSFHPSHFKQATFHLGISTHSQNEAQTALAYVPTYLGFGPIFSTHTKTIATAPQGIERLAHFVKSVSLPVVAIGGIQPHHLPAIAQTGVHAIAMISGLHTIEDLKTLQTLANSCYREDTFPKSFLL